MESDQQIDPGRTDILLQERAASLAAEGGAAVRPAIRLGHLVITVAEAQYGLPLTRLAGAAVYAHCAAVPGARMPLLGVAGIRGEHWAVFDLAPLLGHQRVSMRDGGHVVLLRHDWRRVALRVDRTEGVHRINLAEAQILSVGGERNSGLLSGIVPGIRLRLIDVDALWMHESVTRGG